MKVKEIRSAFLDFFKKKGHEVVKSSSLLPRNDPTLLFTNAGMVQFKSVFQGQETRPYSTAATCQKCIRAGGKHSDIENVGFTARHHTFFEMLGNFSFGDYFKGDAIVYAWELLTEWFRLPVDKLWVSVYEDDDEAISLWKDNTNINPAHIVRLGAKDNFWQMGDTGPCGPCSEIIIDQGEDVGCGKPGCAVGCDCDRYLELWNLVFMQYDRGSDGRLIPLPKPSIDTGMGLERIASVLQGKRNNFDTDLFVPIIEAILSHIGSSHIGSSHTISSPAGLNYGKGAKTDSSIRVIADHVRSVTFLLAEGLMPSNEGRGYVLRRIIRRASRHARLVGGERPFLYEIVGAVAEAMGDTYPEVTKDVKRSGDILRFEEERFFRALEKGTEILSELVTEIKNSGKSVIPGLEVFKLYDTYGFPLDLTIEIAGENGLIVEEAGFQAEMDKQKTRGKASWSDEPSGLPAIMSSLYKDAVVAGETTSFLGYDLSETEAVVRMLVKDGESVSALHEGERGDVLLDKTTFYGESGGQSGDTGTITTEEAQLRVEDTKKTPDGIYVHKVVVLKGSIGTKEVVRCKVSEDKRRSTKRNHTATHLLHASLRHLLGDHVKQAGSLVTPERLRFDFTHFYPLSREEKYKIEALVNDRVLDNLTVSTHVMDLKDAIAYGAMALFDEKYGDVVRVVEAGDFSRELCGGTHCRYTGEIGPFVIVSEGSIASGVRRIEALTGTNALKYLRDRDDELRAISELMRTDNPLERLPSMIKRLKELERQMEQLKIKDMSQDLDDLLGSVTEIGGVKSLILRKDGLDQKGIRDFADRLKEKMRSGIIFLASTTDDQTTFLSMVTKDLTKRFHAGQILKEAAQSAGGRGGGKPDMAQGGTRETDKVDIALKTVYDYIKKPPVT